MKPVILLMLTVLVFGACKKDNNPTPATPGDDTPMVRTFPAREEMNVAYGNHPYQKMDVYMPEGYSETSPVVFLIHGGGFVAGLKEDFTMQAKLFRDQGFVTVNLSHRLVDTSGLLQLPPIHKPSDVKIKDQLADIHAAVNKFTVMSAEWHTNTKTMYMAGHSAGATLALLYSQGDYNDDKHIKACGNWAGATDLSLPHDSLLNGVDPRIIEVYYRAVGAEYRTANNLAFMAYSPYWVININDGRPVISIYPENNVVLGGENEAAGGLTQTRKMHDLLQNKGIAEKLSVYTGADHGFSQQGAWAKLVAETALFFRANQ